MKKVIPLFLLAASLSFQSSADTIALWTFESSVPTNAGPYDPEIGTGSGSGLHALTATYSNPSGNGSVESFSANTWSVGDYFQFSTSTVGFSGIAVTFDHNGSGTGPRDFKLEYSLTGVDGSFTTAGNYSLPSGVTWTAGSPNLTGSTTFSYDLSSVTSLDNAASVYFRLTDTSTSSIGGGTVASGGTSRVDNFTISTVPEPSTIALSLVGGLTALVAIRRKR